MSPPSLVGERKMVAQLRRANLSAHHAVPTILEECGDNDLYECSLGSGDTGLCLGGDCGE